jgi:hypothetical protein
MCVAGSDSPSNSMISKALERRVDEPQRKVLLSRGHGAIKDGPELTREDRERQ